MNLSIVFTFCPNTTSAAATTTTAASTTTTTMLNYVPSIGLELYQLGGTNMAKKQQQQQC